MHRLTNLATLAVVVALASSAAVAGPTYSLSVLDIVPNDDLRVAPDGTPFIADLIHSGSFYAFDRNSSGLVIAASGLYQENDDGLTLLRRLPFLGHLYTLGYAVNERGDALIASYDPQYASSSNFTILRADGGASVSVPISSYRAPKFNNHWDIVGGGVSGGTFLYSDGETWDLQSLVTQNTDGFRIHSVTGINDSGYIVGYGRLPNGSASFLLTPINEVPEPGTAVLVCVAFAAAAAASRRGESPT